MATPLRPISLGHLSDEAVERIANAPENAPPNMDRDELRRSLELSYWHDIEWRKANFTKGALSEHKKRDQRIAKLADELAELTDGAFKSSLYGRYIDVLDRNSLDGLTNAARMPLYLRLLKEASEIVLSNPYSPRPDETAPPLKVFYRRELPKIYERFFKTPAGGSRPKEGGDASGPYIRFAQAVARELALSDKPKTIVKYMREGRKQTDNLAQSSPNFTVSTS